MSAGHRAKASVNELARRFGFEIGRPGNRVTPIAVRRLKLPPSLSSSDVRRGRPVLVDLRRIVTSFGFSYADNGWHPYWDSLRAYLNGSARSWMESPLAEFFERYQPRNAHEALFPGEPVRIEALVRAPARATPTLWTLNARQFRDVCRQGVSRQAERTSWIFGPTSPHEIASEYDRLVSILESLQRYGYRPDAFPDGILHGYFLIAGDDYRFVPTEGQHRLGALRALGVDEVLAVPRFGLGAVHIDDLDRWTTRRGGPYNEPDVEALFERYFEVRPKPWATSADTRAGNRKAPR